MVVLKVSRVTLVIKVLKAAVETLARKVNKAILGTKDS